MNIQSARWVSADTAEFTYLVLGHPMGDEQVVQIHKDEVTKQQYKIIKAWLDAGGVIEPMIPEPAEPTNDELIDLAGPVLVAFIKAFAKREGLTMQQIKAAILAEM